MYTSFKTILIPVDFSINTKVAVAKALDVLDVAGSEIHLLHVKKAKDIPVWTMSATEVEQKLEAWKQSIEASMPTVSVKWQIRQASSVQRTIQETAISISADLIVVGKSSVMVWVPFLKTVVPIKIADQTHIPVLTVKPGALHTRIKTVVVPISSGLPHTKMAAIEMLCKRGKPNIHLLAFEGSPPLYQAAASSLLQVYQWIKAFVHCPVEYALLQGDNKAREILAYAEKVGADMLLVYPELETKVDIWNRHIPDVLPYASKVQVLAVQPAN